MQRIHSHNNFVYFTVSLVILLLTSAFVSSTPEGYNHLLLQAVMFATELVAFFSLSLSKQWRRFIGLMLLLMATATLLREFSGWRAAPGISLGVALVFYSGMAVVAARQVLFSGRVEFNNIVGTAAIYLLLGIIWTLLYLIALEIWPDGFDGIAYRNWHDNFSEAAYFSYVTMTTLGYGDITPTIPITRTLAYLQAVTGTFYMAVVVASMIGTLTRKPQ